MVLRLSVGSFPRDMERLEHLPVFQTPTFLDCEKETKKFEKETPLLKVPRDEDTERRTNWMKQIPN